MEFVIRPYEGYGPIDFGMSRAEIASMFGPPDSELEGYLGTKRYIYHQIGLFVDFDDDARVKFVQVGSPGVPVLDGLRLVGPRAELLATLAERGYELQQGDAQTGDAGSTYVIGRGTVIWCEDDEVETVGAWRRGYWASSPAGPDE